MRLKLSATTCPRRFEPQLSEARHRGCSPASSGDSHPTADSGACNAMKSTIDTGSQWRILRQISEHDTSVLSMTLAFYILLLRRKPPQQHLPAVTTHILPAEAIHILLPKRELPPGRLKSKRGRHARWKPWPRQHKCPPTPLQTATMHILLSSFSISLSLQSLRLPMDTAIMTPRMCSSRHTPLHPSKN